MSLLGVVAVTFVARHVTGVNAATAGFAYLLLILFAAIRWSFWEAALSSIAATLAYNYNFLPPVGTFTIVDPQNWIALFSFLTTALIASRLSTEARRRTLEAVARQDDLEKLYTFSRSILLIERDGPFPKHLARQLEDFYTLETVII